MLEVNSQVLGKGKAFSVDWELKACNNSQSCGLIARIIYQVQFWTDRQRRKPMALVCDEAHMYLPEKDGKNPVEQRAIENFEKISKEGRKYGVALLVVSQRLSDVSPTVLSQCDNIVPLRLANGDDQRIQTRVCRRISPAPPFSAPWRHPPKMPFTIPPSGSSQGCHCVLA